eukprot:6208623-Pleurochrysis_carterae.AAC.1
MARHAAAPRRRLGSSSRTSSELRASMQHLLLFKGGSQTCASERSCEAHGFLYLVGGGLGGEHLLWLFSGYFLHLGDPMWAGAWCGRLLLRRSRA